MKTNRCWLFGDNIDTDQIMPSQYLLLPPEQTLNHVLETQSSTFAKEVKPGDFIVAGDNFGCGSSREHAPLALKRIGLSAIIAKSFARIFFRNSINLGLPLIELPEAGEFADGDMLSVDPKRGLLVNATQKKEYSFPPFEGIVKNIFDEGGLIPYLEKKSS